MRTVIAALVGVVLGAMPASPRADDARGFGGAYVGVNAGAAWGSANYETDPGCPAPAVDAVFCNSGTASIVNGLAVAASGSGDLAATGFTGGIQGGYNWQQGRIVYGAEGDFGAFDFGKSANVAGVFPSAFAGTSYVLSESVSTGWLGTLRGRLGYLATPTLLVYATGGVAFTDFRFASGYADNAVIPGVYPGGVGFGARTAFKAGGVVGAGGEWFVGDSWSIKAEYLYLDFGSTDLPVALTNGPGFAQTMAVDADLSAQVARVGINFRP